jgi:uncharacterized membrane protein YkoI
MNGKLKGALIAAPVIAALAGGGAAIAGATGGGGDSNDKGRDTPAVSGSAFDRASAVALKEAGGGQVSGSEIRDEEGYYEIEVRRSDGSQVDVHLDRNFNVLDASADGGSSGGDGS